MKRTLEVFLCAVAAMAAASCTKSEISYPTDGQRVSAVVNAVSGIATKLSIDGLQTSWEMGDAISVFDNTGKAEGEFVTEDNGTKASFEGSMGEGDILKYAIFPANENATCTDGVFTTTIPAEQDGTISNAVAVAEEQDGIFEFLNATAVIKITIPEDMKGINFVSFTADAPIAGDVIISELTAAPSSAEDAVKYTRVSIYKNGDDLTGDQYLSVIPGNYAGTVVLGKKDGTIRYSAAIKVAAKDYTVDRIKNFGEVSEVSTTWVKNAIPGVFSFNEEGGKFLFAQGDIRYNVETNAWRIADTFVNLTSYSTVEGEVDLFRWNNAATPVGTKDYGAGTGISWSDEGDWTKKLPESGWRIGLDADHNYLFITRQKSGIVKQTFGIVHVGTAEANSKYIVFYPDGWAGSVFSATDSDTAVTLEDLAKLEDQGCAICGLCHRIKKDGTYEGTLEQRYFWAKNWNKTKVVFCYRFLFSSGKFLNESKTIESAYGFTVRPFYEIN